MIQPNVRVLYAREIPSHRRIRLSIVSCATTVHSPFRADAVPIAEGDIDKPLRLSKKNKSEPAAHAPPTNLT